MRLLERRPEIEVTSISSVYETAPVGGVVQANFLNIAVGLSTNLSAWDLLAWLHVIEQSLHRRRLIHWGPRTIDLDIVLYGCTRLTSPTLKIPTWKWPTGALSWCPCKKSCLARNRNIGT